MLEVARHGGVRRGLIRHRLVALVLAAAALSACGGGSGSGSGAPVSSGGTQVVSTSAGNVTVHANAGSLGNVEVSTSAPAGAPAGLSTPFGWFTFAVTGLTSGASVTLTFTAPSGFNLTGYEKCGNGSCSTVPGSTVSGTTLTVTLTDGGAGDADGTANGTITDPGAIIGTSGSAGNASLSGTYAVGWLINLSTGSGGGEGALTADGAGNWSLDEMEDANGTVSSTTVTGTDSIATDGALTFSAADAPTLTGSLSADDDTVVMEDLTSSDQPQMMVATKLGQGPFSNASLDGTYALGALGGFGSSGGSQSGNYGVLLTVTFDGSGNYTVNSETGNDGGTVAAGNTGSGTYSIAADGTISITVASGVLTARLSADGNLLIGAIGGSAQAPELDAAVKVGQGTYSNASLSGTYSAALLANGTPGGVGFLGSLIFDGAGNVTGTASENDAGTITSLALSGTYSVAADGAVTISISGGTGFSLAQTGYLSADGNRLVLQDLTSGDPPGMLLLIH